MDQQTIPFFSQQRLNNVCVSIVAALAILVIAADEFVRADCETLEYEYECPFVSMHFEPAESVPFIEASGTLRVSFDQVTDSTVKTE